jgi:protoporphyrinogen oxidase
VARLNEIEGKKVVVVGGGVAGLTAAEELILRGAEVTVVEREEVVGGLARSFRAEDEVVFDVGPHRFHTDDKEVEALISDVLGEDQRIIDRSSAVWLYNDYHDWPLTRASLLKLPPVVMFRSFLDIFSRPKATDESLESYILSRYGQTLYEVFFRPYTEKFLNYRCSDLHSDWASAGINRAVIDKRLRFDSLYHVARTTLLPPKVRTRFIYPESGGIDRFVESQARRIEARGGRVITGAQVIAVDREGGRVREVEAEGVGGIGCDLLIWTAPLTLLLELLELEPVGLGYLAELLFNFVVRGRAVLPYQWTYYGGAALSFTRASLPTRFNPKNARSGLSGVCVEVVCQESDEIWRSPEQLRRDIEKDLVRVGLVGRREAIQDLHIERVREAYPIYTLDYPGRLQRAIEQVGTTENVALLGRTGTFWYNNMDHSVRQALDLVSSLSAGTTARQWNVALKASRTL